MSSTKKTTIARHTRERKTSPQYGALCTRFNGCSKDGHCKSRCSNNSMKCYKEPKEVVE